MGNSALRRGWALAATTEFRHNLSGQTLGAYVARRLAPFGAEQHALEGDAWKAGLVHPLSVREVEILRLA